MAREDRGADAPAGVLGARELGLGAGLVYSV